MERVNRSLFHRPEVSQLERLFVGMLPIFGAVAFSSTSRGINFWSSLAHLPLGMASIFPISMSVNIAERLLGINPHSIGGQGAEMVVTSALAAVAPYVTNATLIREGGSIVTRAGLSFLGRAGLSVAVGAGLGTAVLLGIALGFGVNYLGGLYLSYNREENSRRYTGGDIKLSDFIAEGIFRWWTGYTYTSRRGV